MFKQNKITSYFKCPLSKPNLKINNTKIKIKNDCGYDSDCYIDEIPEPMTKDKSLLKNEKISRFENDPSFGSPNILSEINKPAEKTMEDFSDDDEDLVNSLIEVESQQSEVNGNNDAVPYDDSTIYFLQMLEDFLNKPSLHYLLEACDLKLLQTFFNYPVIDHKLLLVRMYWLQCKWYKTVDMVKKYLKYDTNETSRSKKVIDDLIDGGFLLNGVENMDFNDWSVVLLRSDLIQVCNFFKINTTKADKSNLIDRLKKFCKTKSTILNHTMGSSKSMEKVVLDKINKLHGNCIKISDKARHVFNCLHVISYLGMNPAVIREKRLNLLLRNVKNELQSFPNVCTEFDSLEFVFPIKENFDEYVYAYNLYEKHFKLTTTAPCNHNKVVEICRESVERYTKLNNEGSQKWLPSIWLHSFTPTYRYIKIMEKSINSYKALKDSEYLNEALKILTILLDQNDYRQHTRASWYSEKALILQTKFKKINQAAETLFDAFKDTKLTEDSKVSLMERAKRLVTQKKVKLLPEIHECFSNMNLETENDLPNIEIYATAIHENQPGKKARYLFRDVLSGEKMYSSVEEYAVLHYINSTDYNNGEHWEGRIICSIFVLLFWDIIYSPVESAKCIFLSPYQEAPLDLYTTCFYENRRERIELRLKEIKEDWSSMDSIVERMQKVYDERKPGEVSIFHSIEWTSVMEITQCLGRNGLFCICKRLSHMYQYAHSGFPDLTIWNSKTKTIMFVEVKGDGDKLSCKQIQWMSYLLKNGIKTEVCYVHKGAKRKSPKKSAKSPLKKTTPESIEINITPKKKRITKPRQKKSKIKDAPCNQEISPKDAFEILSQNNSPSKVSKQILKEPIATITSSPSNFYLRSPSKFSKGGVGYFESPKQITSPTKSPNKSRKRISLALTRRRIFESDT